jgi:hypothetical protein
MGEGRTEPNNADRRDRRRLTVPEAATVLGVTVDAVRGRIRRGKLAAEHEGSTVYVFVGTKEADRPRQSPDESRLVEVLEDQVAYLREQLAVRDEEIRRRDHLLASALERMPALEASREPESPTPPPEVSEGTSTTPDTGAPGADTGRTRRGFWGNLFGG